MSARKRKWPRRLKKIRKFLVTVILATALGASVGSLTHQEPLAPRRPQIVEVQEIDEIDLDTLESIYGPLDDDDAVDWGRAKKTVANLFGTTKGNMDRQEALKKLRRFFDPGQPYHLDEDQIAWGYAKELIANILDIEKDILDSEERRRKMGLLAQLNQEDSVGLSPPPWWKWWRKHDSMKQSLRTGSRS